MLKRTYSKKEAMYDSQKNVPKQEAMTSICCCIPIVGKWTVLTKKKEQILSRCRYCAA